MVIEQTIINAISLTKVTKIPVLFFSNPGLGKTTILQRYAKNNCMHLESLIGSRFSPEEISGYQVNNGGNHLQHMNPEWYDRILQKEKNGIPTLLFIDELSTCSEAVQGPLLSLIFDRTIGSEKYLPESTVIISAANYSANLSSFMNILSPTLNRFCIINLNDNYSALNMIDEFLGSVEVNYPKIVNKLTPEKEQIFNDAFKAFWNDTFLKYSDADSINGVLDISNQELGNIYTESKKYIYNFISGRSLFYLRSFLQAYIELGIDDKEFLHKIIDGFVGNGTCSFKEEKQSNHYRSHIYKGIDKILHQKKTKSVQISFTGDFAKDVASFVVNKDNLSTTAAEDFNALIYLNQEAKKYFNVEQIIQKAKEPEYIAKFITNYESLLELRQLVIQYKDLKNINSQLTKVAMDYYGIYCDMLGITPNFNSTFGVSNNLFERVCFLKIIDENNKEKIVRAAKRNTSPDLYPAFYPIKDDEGLLETGLTKAYSSSEGFRVLIWEDGFKFRHIEKYNKTVKSIA